MRQLLALVATLAAALGTNLVARTADAQDIGSAEAGRTKAGVCAACHGPDGNSVNPEWPSLAGQHASYIVSQLIAYREGRRQNALMSPQAMVLSDEDMHDLAAWFSSQQLTPREADPELLNSGPADLHRRRSRPGHCGVHCLSWPPGTREPAGGISGDRGAARDLRGRPAQALCQWRARGRKRDDAKHRGQYD